MRVTFGALWIVAAMQGAGGGPVGDVETDPLAAVRREARVLAAELEPGAGLRTVVAEAEAGRFDLALAVVEELAGPERVGTLREQDLAALDLARGWLELSRGPELLTLDAELAPEDVGRFEGVRAAFGRARAVAGSGEVRLRAVQALGTLELWEAERAFRSLVRELQSGAALAPSAGQAPDPLERVRNLGAEFAQARDLLIERVRLDWKAEDPRANLEWCSRRLRELEELERQLEQQEEQEPPPQPEPQEDGEPSSEDPMSGEGQPQPDEGQPQDGDDGSPPEESDPGAESEAPGEQGEESPAEDAPGEESAQSEPTGTDEGGDMASDGAPEEGEPALSEEEITALLDRLAEIESQVEEARERARLLRIQRTAVERDW